LELLTGFDPLVRALFWQRAAHTADTKVKSASPVAQLAPLRSCLPHKLPGGVPIAVLVLRGMANPLFYVFKRKVFVLDMAGGTRLPKPVKL